MPFFEEVNNPTKLSSAGIFSRMNSSVNKFGRQTFAKNFARGGLSSYVFSSGGRRPWMKTRRGSPEYFRRLERMNALEGGPKFSGIIAEERKLAAAGKFKTKPLTLLGYGALGSAFVLSPFVTEETGREKLVGAAKGITGLVGWEAGGVAGMSIGAAVGSVIPVVGTALGAGIGYLAGGLGGSIIGEEMVNFTAGRIQQNVDASKQARTLNWGQGSPGLNTRTAATMRARSIQMMNRGMITSRSSLGQEGAMFHR